MTPAVTVSAGTMTRSATAPTARPVRSSSTMFAVDHGAPANTDLRPRREVDATLDLLVRAAGRPIRQLVRAFRACRRCRTATSSRGCRPDRDRPARRRRAAPRGAAARGCRARRWSPRCRSRRAVRRCSLSASASTRRERERVAIVTLPCIAERGGALGNQLERERAELPGFVEMDVDTDLVSFGDPEHDIQMSHRITVEATRIDPADQIGAGEIAASRRSAVPGSRTMPDCGNATTSTRQRSASAGESREHALEPLEPSIRVDFRVTANVHGTGRDCRRQGEGRRDRRRRLRVPPVAADRSRSARGGRVGACAVETATRGGSSRAFASHIREGGHDDATGAFDRLDRRRDDPVPVRIADLVDAPGADHDVPGARPEDAARGRTRRMTRSITTA